MPTTLSATQNTLLLLDNDGDGIADPGDILQTTVTISNTGAENATNVSFAETLNGMTLNGGTLNASPIAFNDSYSATTHVPFTATISVLANDTEPLGPEGLALNTGTAIENPGVAVATTQGGSATVKADGTFTYTSAPGFAGTDTFTYTLRDTGIDGIAGNADDLTSIGTVSIAVAPAVSVWFIDNNAGPGQGDGTQNNPFRTIADFNAANDGAQGHPSAGDIVYLRHGTGTYSEADGINLLDGQKLIGQGQDLVVNGITIETGSAGQTPTIVVNGGANDGIDLAQNNTISGLNVNTTSGSGIGIDDNGHSVGTLSMSDISVSTSSGAGILIDQGGTVTVTGDGNTIISGIGTALNITNTTIGAADVTFQSISANGAVDGIVLNNTGTVGGFTVTGDGGSANNGSGGTIQNTTGAGVLLTNTQNVSFDQLNLSSTGGSGVQGTLVGNFSHTNSTFTSTGNAFFESGIAFNDSDNVNTGLGDTGATFGDNISGTVTITGNTFTNPFYSGLDVQSDNGTVTSANVSNNTVTNPGFSGVNFVGIGNTSTAFNLNDADIANNTITSSGGNGIQISISANLVGPGAKAGFVTIGANGQPISDPNHIISITGNLITIDAAGLTAITVANSGGNPNSRTQTNFEISNNGTPANPLDSGDEATVILIGNNGYADMAGLVHNNVIDPNHTPNSSGANGIGGGNGVAGAGNAWTPNLNLSVTNNTISGTDGNGILLVGRGTSGIFDLKIADNTVDAPVNAGGSSREGIRVDAGNASSADDAVFLNIFGNTSAGSNGAAGIGIRKQGTVATTNDFGIFDAAGGPSLPAPPTNTAIASFISALNPNSADGVFGIGGTDIINGSNFLRDTTFAPPLLAVTGGVDSSTPNTGEQHLTQAELDSVVSAAIANWAAAGLSAAQIATLEGVTFSVKDLPGLNLASFQPGVITLDADGAGRGWYLDGTPLDSAEFGTVWNATRLTTDSTGAPAGHYDLLTSIMHEQGHALGLADTYAAGDRNDLMYGWLFTGERRLPDVGEANGAVAGSISKEAFLGAPIDIGTLPADQTVTIQWQATIDPQTNQLIVNPVNQGQVTGDNFTSPVTTNQVATAVDSLTLGNLVFNDVNHNGVFDAGTDTGINGVALTLFADDGDGVFDAGDIQIATTTTAGGGLYSFTGLAPGTYMVRADQSNFDTGGALQGTPRSAINTVDPDNNVNNDDNANAVAGNGVVTLPITLDYNTEPTAGVGNDTNNTLDIGVQANVVTITGSAKADTINATTTVAGQPLPTGADDIITGGKGKDTIDALGGNDVVDGGRDADRLTGGAGNDVLTGGDGKDTFVFKAGFGNDRITDFEEGKKVGDVIEIDHNIFADFAAVLAHSANDGSGNVVITTADGVNSITLVDVLRENLNANDFHFV